MYQPLHEFIKLNGNFLTQVTRENEKIVLVLWKRIIKAVKRGFAANMLYVFVIPVIPKLISFIRTFAIDISKIFIVVLYYFFNVRVPRNFDIASIVFDCFINVMEVKVTIATENVFDSFCVLDRYFFTRQFYLQYFNKEIKNLYRKNLDYKLIAKSYQTP